MRMGHQVDVHLVHKTFVKTTGFLRVYVITVGQRGFKFSLGGGMFACHESQSAI